MNVKEFLDSHKDEIIHLYETLSMKDIAINFGVHIQDISNFLKIHNIPKKKRVSPAWSEARRKKFINTFNSKTEEEKIKIKEKRANTNLQKFGSTTNLQSAEAIQNRINKFGSNSPLSDNKIKEKMLINNAEKHNGLSNPYQWAEVKEKSKQTKLDKYGDMNYHNIEKIKQTNLDRYGVESYMSTDQFKQQAKQTNLQKYGVAYFSQTELFKSKFTSHYKNKTGYDYPMQNPKILKKSTNTIKEKYGVNWNCQREEARQYHTKSKINLWWKDYLELSDQNMEFNLNDYSFDLKKDNILIEIDPAYTHNSTLGPIFNNSKAGKPLDNNYHYQKTKVALEAGYTCIHIWDWDDPVKIKMLLQDKTAIYARNLVIKEVSKQDTDLFLNTYHLQNTCKNQTIRLGLYTKDTDELIQIMTFGKPRYNSKYEYELLRLCTKAEYTVIGGSKKLFKHFIKTYNPNSIISYCDNSKFKGTVYSKLGFKLKSYGKPSCHWYNIKTKDHITDNLLRQQGADRLLGTNFGKGTSNKDIMLQFNFLEVYDCGQSSYVWNK